MQKTKIVKAVQKKDFKSKKMIPKFPSIPAPMIIDPQRKEESYQKNLSISKLSSSNLLFPTTNDHNLEENKYIESNTGILDELFDLGYEDLNSLPEVRPNVEAWTHRTHSNVTTTTDQNNLNSISKSMSLPADNNWLIAKEEKERKKELINNIQNIKKEIEYDHIDTNNNTNIDNTTSDNRFHYGSTSYLSTYAHNPDYKDYDNNINNMDNADTPYNNNINNNNDENDNDNYLENWNNSQVGIDYNESMNSQSQLSQSNIIESDIISQEVNFDAGRQALEYVNLIMNI